MSIGSNSSSSLADSPETNRTEPANVCIIHQSRRLILHCNSCGEAVCDECLASGNHDRHKFVKLEEACESQIMEVEKMTRKLMPALKEKDYIKARVAQLQTNIQEMYDQGQTRLTNHYKELRELIDHNEEKAKSLILALREGALRDLGRLTSEDGEHRHNHAKITGRLPELKSAVDTNSAPTLQEIKKFHIEMEAMKQFYKHLEERIHVDTRRLQALENSVAGILEKNKTLLPRLWEFAENLTFDKSTIKNKHLKVSEDSIKYMPHHHQRRRTKEHEDAAVNVLAAEAFSSGCHYWEVEVKNRMNWTVGVVEQGWKVASAEQALGQDRLSWALQSEDGVLVALHHHDTYMVSEHEPFERVGVFLDCDKGKVDFICVETRRVFHAFQAKFKKPLLPAFSIPEEETNAPPLTLCHLVPWDLGQSQNGDSIPSNEGIDVDSEQADARSNSTNTISSDSISSNTTSLLSKIRNFMNLKARRSGE